MLKENYRKLYNPSVIKIEIQKKVNKRGERLCLEKKASPIPSHAFKSVFAFSVHSIVLKVKKENLNKIFRKQIYFKLILNTFCLKEK